jgi:hypothetical protein
VLTDDADAGPMPGSGRERRIATGAPDSVELGAEPRRVALRPAADPAAEGTQGRARAGRLYLHLEDAETVAGGGGSVWEVRVEGGRVRRAHASGEAAVGTIAFSGRCGDAQRFVFDVTDAVGDLGDDWEDRALEVTFHPARPAGPGAQPRPAARVGSVFLTHD